MSISESPDFHRGLANGRADAGAIEPISETMRRWDAERDMLRADPVRALLLRIEAVAAGRAENHACEAAKLPIIADLARRAIEAQTGKPFKNPIFP